MKAIPKKVKDDISSDPYYKSCAREDSLCDGKLTWEHAIIYAGRQVQEKWAIIPLCEYHHSVNKYQDIGGLDKRENERIAYNRATDDELRKYSKAVDLIKERDRLNKLHEK